MVSIQSGCPGTFDMDSRVVDEQGFGRFQSGFFQHISENFRVGFFHTDDEGEPGLFEEGIEIAIAIMDMEIVYITVVVNLVGVAEQKNPVVFSQTFKDSDPFRGDIKQEGIPRFIDLLIGQGKSEMISDLVAEIVRRYPSGLKLFKESGSIGNCLFLVEALQTQRMKGAFGKGYIDITDNSAKIEDNIFNPLRGGAFHSRMGGSEIGS